MKSDLEMDSDGITRRSTTSGELVDNLGITMALFI